jgi:putative flippase GtrA
VGGLGIVVQLGTLGLLSGALRVHYLIATALAVEAAVLHNFFWHESFTWHDRKGPNRPARLLKFNLTTGVFSIAGNVLFTKLLADAGLSHLAANIGAIGLCSVINFLLNDRLVFVKETN